ncbi:MAG: c-type cytochrome [bacterium]
MNLEHHYDRLYKKLTIAGSLVCIVFFGMAAIEENFLREWKNHQQEYKEILVSKAETDKERAMAEDFPIEIKQLILDDFNRVDRCITCHNGIEDPRMADQVPPHARHPGDYVQNHPIDKFGCSICHGGQDRALAIKNVFARDEDVHWDYPVLPLDYVQSSCGKCHLAVFDRQQTLAGAEVLIRGRAIFYREGCFGCHSVRDVGGSVGPDLTDHGSKTKHEYSFKNIEDEHTVQNWLLEHFLNPQKVSGSSEMPPIELSADEMDALITFTMALYQPEFASSYYSLDPIAEFKGRRKPFAPAEAYAVMCAVCHGKKGAGKDYRVFQASVPALNNPDFLAVASDEMIEFTIANGRSGRNMSSWAAAHGGLSGAEITALVDLIRRWKPKPPTFARVNAAGGDAETGRKLFRSRCGICHGANGEGGIGPSLNNQDLLTIASDMFLYKTIVEGRRNTAMPSWSQLSAREVANLIAFMRSWQNSAPRQLSARRIIGNVENGRMLFNSMCVGCHGRYGQGSVGPAILNKDFLSAASDEFILRSISRGRSRSAMRSWSKRFQGMEQLADRELKDIVAYMRSQEDVKREAIYTNITPGTPTRGKVLYESMCAGCHGVNGEGKHGPALNNQEFLNAATDGFLQATIALGRSGTAMRSWAKGAQGYEELDAEQINDIVAYIRTWQKQVIAFEH